MSEQIAKLISAVVLDPAAAEGAYAKAVVRAESGEEPLTAAIDEAWWQMRSIGRTPYELQPFLADGDPVMALTVFERTVLALGMRLGLSATEIGQRLKISAKRAQKVEKSARRELARAAIAMTLLTNPNRCPITEAKVAQGSVLTRRRALSLVTHAAECSICVPYLRTVDRRIVQDYQNARTALIEPKVLPTVEDVRAEIAGRQVTWTERIPNSSTWLKWAAISGAASSILLIVALFFGR